MSDSSISKHIPEGKTWLRAAVSSIPMVGSALDHLIFDKADSIRTSNLEAALNAVSHRLEQIPENLIDKEWFQSEEALATFRLLSEKTSFEPDKQKIQDLGRVAATCGTTSLSKDSKKLSVFDHISRLSPVQSRLLLAISSCSPRTKTVSGGDIQQSLSAIWPEDIKATLQSGTIFWEGTLNLALELEILESMNMLRRIPVLSSADTPLSLTALGQYAVTYLRQAAL